MTQKSKSMTENIRRGSISTPLLIGAGIALFTTIVFISGGEADPEWSKYWMVRPLIVVPLAGAAGGAFYYLMGKLRQHGGWKWLLANFVSLIVYAFCWWIGTVIGFAGTMWN